MTIPTEEEENMVLDEIARHGAAGVDADTLGDEIFGEFASPGAEYLARIDGVGKAAGLKPARWQAGNAASRSIWLH